MVEGVSQGWATVKALSLLGVCEGFQPLALSVHFNTP